MYCICMSYLFKRRTWTLREHTCLSSRPVHIVRNKGMLLSNAGLDLEFYSQIWDDTHSSIRCSERPSLTLNIPRGGASTTPLGNPFQCFTTLTVKNFFVIPSRSLLSFNLKAFILSHRNRSCWSLSLSVTQPPVRHWQAALTSWSLLSRRLSSPSCSSAPQHSTMTDDTQPLSCSLSLPRRGCLLFSRHT